MADRRLSVAWERSFSELALCELYEKEKKLFYRAVGRGRALRLLLRLPRRLGARSVKLRVWQEGQAGSKTTLSFAGLSGAHELYEATIAFDKIGLTFFDFCIDHPQGTLYSNREATGMGMTFCLQEGGRPHRLTVTDFLYPEPRWLLGGVIYHVFVDRFYKSGERKMREDAVYNPDWEGGCPQYPAYPGAPLENNEFFGGTLLGICEKLPYLAALGVSCIYLSPIFEAYSNHKYDTGDYRKIDEMFGGEEAFFTLIEKAASHGIRLLLDGVFNHTGDDSVYFNRYGRYPGVGAYQSKGSPYYDWYRFSRYPDEYTSWWGISILPRIHPSESLLCRDFFVGEDGVVAHYAKCGIGGFRLDVVDELADDFTADIKKQLSGGRDTVLYGEVWEDASDKVSYGVRKKYYDGRHLDGVMNYPLREGLLDYFRWGATEKLTYALCEVLPNMPKRIADLTMNLLGTNDTIRVITALGGASPNGHSNQALAELRMSKEERARGITRLKMAYLTLGTLPGVPAIYYGDEVGLEGYSDPFNRRPFPWHRMEEKLLCFYRAVGALRRREAVYRRGEFCLLHLSGDCLLFKRYNKRRALFTVINRSPSPLRLFFSSEARQQLSGRQSGREFLLEGNGGNVFSAAAECKVSFTK